MDVLADLGEQFAVDIGLLIALGVGDPASSIFRSSIWEKLYKSY